MKLIKRFRNYLYRKYNEHPSVDEISACWSKLDNNLTEREVDFIMQYMITGTLEKTAETMNVTRERTRQVLWKIWRKTHYGN